MLAHVRANLLLLVLSIALCNVAYPLVLLVIGQTVFHDKAEGSLLYDKNGNAIGSRLIAQPFSGEGYFQPRPSAVSYNAAASGATNWGANNYLLRERVARQLGPIVKYAGARKGQPVGPDVETWFQKDTYQGQVGIVSQWAAAHPAVAANWAKADPLNGAYVLDWMNEHAEDLAQWKKDNPAAVEPKPEELAVAFFASFSKAHPGMFPSIVETALDEGKTAKKVQPANQGPDIQGIFFDLWRQEHPAEEIQPVPADMVMASGSGLDPHITLKNALYQLERVAAKRAEETGREPALLKLDIEELLREHAHAPLSGLAGVDLINVLEINLLLRDRYESPASSNNERPAGD